MKRRGFSTVEALLSIVIISSVLATASAGHLRLTKAFVSVKNTCAQTVSEDEILTRMFNEIKSATTVNADGAAMKIENGMTVVMYENLGGELYRNGELLTEAAYSFEKSDGFVTVSDRSFFLKVRCGE